MNLRHDLLYTARMLRRNPGFAVAVVATLSVAIGATTAIFSVVSGVLLRPLPYTNPGRLAEIPDPVSVNDLDEFRAAGHSFEGVAAHGMASRNLLDVADPERLAACWGERNLFDVLGASPLLGRTFRPGDPLDAVVISEGLWRRRFNADPGIPGRRINLDGVPNTILGVMPESFHYPLAAAAVDLWIPWELPAGAPRTRRVDSAVAHIRLGIPLETAIREWNTLAARLAARHPERRDPMPRLIPIKEYVTGAVRPALLALLGAVGFVLLIACANVGNLLLARAARRAHELSVRAALGAGRARLAGQLLTESLALSFLSALGGWSIAILAFRLIVRAASARIPRAAEISLDWRVYAFLLAASGLTGLAFGLLPGIAASRANPLDAMKRSRHSGMPGFAGNWLRDALVVGEIALAFVLLIGAGLTLRSFLQLIDTPVGLNAERTLVMRLSIGLADYAAPGSYGRYLQNLENRLAEVPGVRTLGFIQYLPLQNWGWRATLEIPGRAEPASCELRYVSPGYFQAMGVPLKQGRLLDTHDTPQSPPVILVNETLARRYFAGQDPIGRRTNRGTIVGVVGDVHGAGLDRAALPEVYYAFAQNTAATSQAGVALVVRTLARPEATAPSIVAAIREVNPRQVVFDVKTMERVIDDSVSDRRLYTWLIGLFAAMALALAASGVYAVISYLTAARTREFGIRIALGAKSSRIARLVLQRSSLLASAGVAIGAFGAMAAGKILAALGAPARPGLSALLLAGLLLGLVAIAASAAPALRAARTDPNTCLREE